MMTGLDRSARLIRAIDSDGTKWPQWHTRTTQHTGCTVCKALDRIEVEDFDYGAVRSYCAACNATIYDDDNTFETEITKTGYFGPDLTAPENLAKLLEVADELCAPCDIYSPEYRLPNLTFTVKCWLTNKLYLGYGPTRSLAVMAALEQAAGIKEDSK